MNALMAVLLTAAAPLAATPQAADPAPETFTINLSFPPKEQQAPAPIEIVGGHILFQADLMGKKAWVLLDNRSERSVIDTAFAEKAGLAVETKDGVIHTLHSAVPKKIIRDISFSVPGVVNVQAGAIAATDLSAFSALLDRPISAVFGGDYLKHLTLIVMASKGAFRVGPGDAVRLPPAMPRVALLNDRPQVALDVGGTTLTATLDLGDNGMLFLSREAWQRVAPADAELTQTAGMGLDGQPYMLDSGKLPEVTLGRFRREDVEVRILPELPTADGDARIGAGFLANCDFLLDIKGGKLVIIPYLKSGATSRE